MSSTEACADCSEWFAPLLGELDRIRKHDPSIARVRKYQLKNRPSFRSLGQNHKARRQWLWTHALDSYGNYKGHRRCISQLTRTDVKTLTTLKATYKKCMHMNRAYPARVVLKDNELLNQLIYSGSDEPANWAVLSVRRKWLLDLIESSGDKNTLVFLPQNSLGPPIHGNVLAKLPQNLVQREHFKEYVLMNSVPTGRKERGKTHYLIPFIRRIKTPNKHAGPLSASEQARFKWMCEESLATVFNSSLNSFDPPVPNVSEDSIRKWFRELFPRYGISPLQSDYCDTCAELKQQFESIKRSKQHLIDNGNTQAQYIDYKQTLMDSYQSALSIHTKLAGKEQEEYKKCTSNSSAVFKNLTAGTLEARQMCLSKEAVLSCDFQMGKLVPHWGRSAQPGKTYYSQKILHHIFGIVNSTLGKDKFYIIDETVAGEKDSNHVCSHLFEYVQNELSTDFQAVKIYLDAAPYFKTCYVMWWAAEMITQGRFQRVIFVFMVPGHTKFEVDLEFSRIANKFYKTDVFNTGQLVDLIRSCGMQAVQVPAQNLCKWKTCLSKKYRDIPRITEWNYMEITGNRNSSPTLKVKRSSQDTEFVSCFNEGTEFNLLQSSVAVNATAVPTYLNSAAVDQTMQKPLRGKKLKSVSEMYTSFIDRELWPTQLLCAVESDSEENTVDSHIPLNSQHDEQAVRIGALLGTPQAASRAHTYLRRVSKAARDTDDNFRKRLDRNPYSGIRTLPRRSNTAKAPPSQ